jgi:Tol biopolymer transport system component
MNGARFVSNPLVGGCWFLLLLGSLLGSACSNGGESTDRSADHGLPAMPRATGHTTLPGAIVFAAGNGRDIRIYRARGDGSRRHLLIEMTPGLDMAPAVSPHGRRMIWRHNRSPTTDASDIWLMNLRNGHRRNLTRSASQRNWGATWSPDGRWIAYNHGGPEGPELWRMRPDGSAAHRIAPGWAEYPRFSPDGGTIVFESRRDGNYEIYTIRPDGTGLRRLTHTPQDDGDASFSPDGSRIVFISQRDSTNRSSSQGSGFETARQVYLMRPDGSRQRRLVADRASDELPTWLPDGRILFFSIRLPSAQDGNARFLGAFVTDTDATRIRRAHWPRQEVEISWLPGR